MLSFFDFVSLGNSLLFGLMMPTKEVLLVISFVANDKLVKKLTVVTVLSQPIDSKCRKYSYTDQFETERYEIMIY